MIWYYRWIYEKFNIHIYIIIPSLLILLISHFTNCIPTEGLQEHSIEISLTFLGVFLTLMGILVAFPSSEALALLQRYKHIQIVFLTLVCGIISSLLLLISGLLKYHEYSLHLFTIMITETVIAAVKLYGMSKFISNSMSKYINKN